MDDQDDRGTRIRLVRLRDPSQLDGCPVASGILDSDTLADYPADRLLVAVDRGGQVLVVLRDELGCALVISLPPELAGWAGNQLREAGQFVRQRQAQANRARSAGAAWVRAAGIVGDA